MVVQAEDFKVANIHISHPFAKATVPGQISGSAYLKLENKGKSADKLTKVESAIAKSVELHTMEMEGEVMKMREVKEISLNAGEKIEMHPGGGYHIMLVDLRQPLKAGEKFSLTLTFEKAGKLNVIVNVEEKVGTATLVNHQH
jgi:copper(I)-binding protein